jgi:hypothetical protein
MKKIVFIVLILIIFVSQRSYAQVPFFFEPRCTGYLVSFCHGLLTSSTDCKQWTGNCNLTDNIQRDGGVMIGASSLLECKLAVSKGIISTSLRVLKDKPWPDYVFDDSYKLMPLEEVKAYINTNGHLPQTPSASEIEKQGGLEIGSVFINHQEKIEEIFLHLIELKKTADTQQKENEDLDKEYIALTLILIDKVKAKMALTK